MEMTITEGHRFKARGGSLKDIYKASVSFPQRVVGTWNVLPGKVVETDMIEMFKRHFDRHVEIEACGLRADRWGGLDWCHGRNRHKVPACIVLCSKLTIIYFIHINFTVLLDVTNIAPGRIEKQRKLCIQVQGSSKVASQVYWMMKKSMWDTHLH